MSGEWEVEILVIVSNYENLCYIVECFEIFFEIFFIIKVNKVEQEQWEIELMCKLDIDFIVLACYM